MNYVRWKNPSGPLPIFDCRSVRAPLTHHLGTLGVDDAEGFEAGGPIDLGQGSQVEGAVNLLAHQLVGPTGYEVVEESCGKYGDWGSIFRIPEELTTKREPSLEVCDCSPTGFTLGLSGSRPYFCSAIGISGSSR